MSFVARGLAYCIGCLALVGRLRWCCLGFDSHLCINSSGERANVQFSMHNNTVRVEARRWREVEVDVVRHGSGLIRSGWGNTLVFCLHFVSDSDGGTSG